jgi:hypothetical protein
MDSADTSQVTGYSERGGLRWRNALYLTANASCYVTANASWPFARITGSPERVRLTVKCLNLVKSFDLEKHDITAIRKVRGWLSTGIRFEHRKAEYPPFLLFWMTRKSPLVAELRRMGYDVAEN